MNCWKCGALTYSFQGPMPFRATCDSCHAWLHCCSNCKYYQKGLANDCQIPNTEYVRDRQSCNFCEDFKAFGKGPTEKEELSDTFHRLFKEGEKVEKEKAPSFDSLFK